MLQLNKYIIPELKFTIKKVLDLRRLVQIFTKNRMFELSHFPQCPMWSHRAGNEVASASLKRCVTTDLVSSLAPVPMQRSAASGFKLSNGPRELLSACPNAEVCCV